MTDVALFDLFDTLITESETRWAGAASLGPRLGLDDAAYRAEWSRRLSAIVTGRLTFVETAGRDRHGARVYAREREAGRDPPRAPGGEG
jgi:hypothetical protein